MNISVSAALFIYEVTRQRHAKGLASYLMDEEQVQQTLTYFAEMQSYFTKRNKRLRKARAYKRKGLSLDTASIQDDTPT